MIKEAIGPYDELLSIVKKRKLRWYGHVMRSTGLSKTILQGTVEGTRRRGGQRRRWEDDITKWTGLGPVETMRLTKDRHRWAQLSATSTVVTRRSSRSRDSEVSELLNNYKPATIIAFVIKTHSNIRNMSLRSCSYQNDGR